MNWRWRNLSIQFLAPRTVRSVSVCDWQVEPGDVVVVAGPSGVGKSTFLKTLCGLVPVSRNGRWRWPFPYSNAVQYKGQIDPTPHTSQEHTSYMPQEAPFLDGLSILDNVRLLGDGCTDTSALRGELEDVLYQLGVDHELNTSVEVLSGGERQRVAIARCLLNRTAELFCLDEPFSHIDQYNRRRAMDMVYRHSVERKRSFLVVSHDVADLIPFASSVILFANHTPEETLGAAWRLTGDDTYSEIPEDLRRALPADEGLTLVLPENGGTAIPRRVSREDLEICDADREMGIDAWMLGPGLYDRDLMTLFVPAQKICMDGKVGAVVAGSVVMHCSRSVRRGVRVRLSHKSGRF